MNPFVFAVLTLVALILSIKLYLVAKLESERIRYVYLGVSVICVVLIIWHLIEFEEYFRIVILRQ